MKAFDLCRRYNNGAALNRECAYAHAPRGLAHISDRGTLHDEHTVAHWAAR